MKLMRLLPLLGIAAALCFCCKRCRKRKRPPRTQAPQRPQCYPIPAPIYRRPDPCIYSQKYLMSKGLAVTWQNPDVHLEFNGAVIDSSELKPSTQYDIVARIWNGSFDAPAVNMPVNFYYLTFGIATVQTYIGTTRVDLPVRGAPGHPVFTRQEWTTPNVPGHYCLLIELIWADDANPANNVGQHNTNVKKLNSPHAAFTFPVRNPVQEAVKIRLEIDTYELPAQRSCEGQPAAPAPQPTRKEFLAHRRAALAVHARDSFPVPPGWLVGLSEVEMSLGPEEQRDLTVDITAPDSFVGRQAINVHGFNGTLLIAGVTLYVES
jgi:hypothetical protein